MDEKSLTCVVTTVIIVFLLLLATSFDSLEPTQYGLNYNRVFKSFDRNEIYEGGRHWIWPTNKFIEFPATQQTVELSDSSDADASALKTRTQEGLALTLHIAFQYKLIKEEIPKLYDLSNLQYEQTLIRIARDTILQEAGNYQAPQYWKERDRIGKRIEGLLDASFKPAHARCLGIQLLKVSLPPAFEQAIVDTQVEVQMTQMKQLEQTAEIVRQNINVMVSETDQQILVINANARATSIFVRETARASIFKETLKTESFVFEQVVARLGFNNTQLSTYQYFQGLVSQKGKRLLVNVENPIIQLAH